MATMLDIVTDALRLLGELEATTTPSAEDAATCLVTLNDIGAQLDAQDIHAGWSVALTLSDECPLDAKHHLAIKSMLACEVAPKFGVVPAPKVEANAKVGWQLIKAAYYAMDNLRVDEGLTIMPSQRLYW